MKSLALLLVSAGLLALAAGSAVAMAAPRALQCSVADDKGGKRDFTFSFDLAKAESQIAFTKNNVFSAKLAADVFGLRADFGSITLVIDRASGYIHYEHFRWGSEGWKTDAVMTGLCRAPGSAASQPF
jgi:hypothetical protein